MKGVQDKMKRIGVRIGEGARMISETMKTNSALTEPTLQAA